MINEAMTRVQDTRPPDDTVVSTTSGPVTATTTDLHLAAAHGQLTLLSYLTAIAETIDVRDERASTPLLEACRRGHHDAVSALLAAGADPLAADQRGSDALAITVDRRDERLLPIILAAIPQRPASATTIADALATARLRELPDVFITQLQAALENVSKARSQQFQD